jgi:hypothetical protein
VGLVTEPINLNRARKARDRARAKEQAAANRVAFGRTRAQKEADAIESERRARALDGATRERPGSGPPES